MLTVTFDCWRLNYIWSSAFNYCQHTDLSAVLTAFSLLLVCWQSHLVVSIQCCIRHGNFHEVIRTRHKWWAFHSKFSISSITSTELHAFTTCMHVLPTLVLCIVYHWGEPERAPHKWVLQFAQCLLWFLDLGTSVTRAPLHTPGTIHIFQKRARRPYD